MKNDQLYSLLYQLEKKTEIPYSDIPSSLRQEFRNFGDMKACFSVEKSSHGKKFKVINQQILQNEIKRLFPNTDLTTTDFRAKNLALRNNTKDGKTTLKYSYITCKAIGKEIFFEANGKTFDVSKATELMGCFSFAIEDNSDGYKCGYDLLLVENQQLIDEIEWLSENWNGIILYYGGNISERLMNWIKKSHFKSITLFPDYDAVGISNFSKLKAEIPSVDWFWMEDWEALLSKYGNKSLWRKEKQKALFEKSWCSFRENGFPDAKLEKLMAKMREEGKMLEQESVMLKRNGDPFQNFIAFEQQSNVQR